ncbi:MAG: RNA polymerase sigma factor [Ruminococcaceae bacterium]|nr:RNA polymerase sigma factor [Oscillospiraceae bacterium]
MDNGESSYRRFRIDGDEQGLVEIIKEYKDGLIFYLNSFVGNLSVAEELCEDTFVLIGTKKPKDKGKGSFKTWLYTIGRNIAVDYLRKQKRKNETPIETVFGLSDDEQAFEDEFIKEERNKTLYSAMKKLKAEYRQVLWLIYFENFSNKEVSAVMKKSVHAVETLAYRARIALKNELEKEGFNYEEL